MTSSPEIPVVDLCSSQESDSDYNHTGGTPARKRKGHELGEDRVYSLQTEKKRRNSDGSTPSTSGLIIQNTVEDTRSLDSENSNKTHLTHVNFIKLTERVRRMERAMENHVGMGSILPEENLSSSQSKTVLLNDGSGNHVRKNLDAVLSKLNNLEERMKMVEGTMQRLQRTVEKHTSIVSAMKSIFTESSSQSEDEVSSINNPTVSSDMHEKGVFQNTRDDEESTIPEPSPEVRDDQEGTKEATASTSSMLPDSHPGEHQHLPIPIHTMEGNAGKQSVHSAAVNNDQEGTKKKNEASISTSTTAASSPLQPVVGGNDPTFAEQSTRLPTSSQAQSRQVPTHKDVMEGDAGKKSVENAVVRNNPGTKAQDGRQPVVHGKNPATDSASNMRTASNVTVTKGLELTPARNNQLVPTKLNELLFRTTTSASPTKPVLVEKNQLNAHPSRILPNSNQGLDQQVQTPKGVMEGNAATRRLLITPLKTNQGTKKQNGHPPKMSTPTSASPMQSVVSGKKPAFASGPNMQNDSNQQINVVLNSEKHMSATTSLESSPSNHQLVTKKSNEHAMRTSSTISASPAQPVMGGKKPAVASGSNILTNSNQQTWHSPISTPTKFTEGNAGRRSLQSTPAKNSHQVTEKQNASVNRNSTTISVVATQPAFAPVASGSNMRTNTTQGLNPNVSTSKKTPPSTISVVATQPAFAPVASGSNMRTNTTQGLNPNVSTSKKTPPSTPARVLPSNTGTQCVQSSPARRNDQARMEAVQHPIMSNTVTGATGLRSVQFPSQLNIRVKQELLDSFERGQGVNLCNLNTDNDGRIQIFICGRAKKISSELDKYVTLYGFYFIHNHLLKFAVAYDSDLKTTDVKRQAEVIAALHALYELESRVGNELCATIITKYKGLVTFMEKHKKFLQDLEGRECLCNSKCRSSEDHVAKLQEFFVAKEHFSKPFPSDMLLLVNKAKNLDIKWVKEDSLVDIHIKHQTNLFREQIITTLKHHNKNRHE